MPGSRVIITTRDEQVLIAHGVNIIHDVNLLSHLEAMRLFSRHAFKSDIPNQGYEELSRKVVRYAAGLPLTIKVLGSYLCGRVKLEWVDAIKRLKTIPLKETLEKLELSYNGLDNDQKEIFLDVVCILKGVTKHDAIRILESCGFNAQIGLSVLQQKSLITISHRDVLDFHDHIEEMGWNIVRRLHPNEPSRHTRLWIQREIEDILVSELGTEATRSIKLDCVRVNPTTIIEGLRKMNELRLLYVNDDEVNQKILEYDDVYKYLPDALQSLCWRGYPFRYLPKTFQENKLVNLEIHLSKISELWEGGEKKVLNKLRFLDISLSNLRTLDLSMTPHLEVLNLQACSEFEELQLPVKCPNLKVLKLRDSKVSTLNLGMTPNLEILYLVRCSYLQRIHAPVGCLKKLVCFSVRLSLNFVYFEVRKQHKSANLDYVATFKIYGLVRECQLHPKSDFSMTGFTCEYDEARFSWSQNLEKLISFGACVCENYEYILATLCGIQHLRELTLEHSIPTDLWKLEILDNLSFEKQWFNHLPDSICMLKHLKSLELCYCLFLEQLPENIYELECLELLRITGAVILRDIPTNICKMKCLKYIDLRFCYNLKELPEDLGNLKELRIDNTSISHLPHNIYQLKGLHIYESCEKFDPRRSTSMTILIGYFLLDDKFCFD